MALMPTAHAPLHWNQSPSDIYRLAQGVLSDDGMYKTESGLVLPIDTVLENLKKSAEARRIHRKIAMGSAMSDWFSLTGANSSDAMEKPADQVSYTFLRDAYNHSPIDQILINHRIEQVRSVARKCLNPQVQAGFRIVSERWLDPQYVEDEATRKRCLDIERVLLSPNPRYHARGFEDVLVNYTREQMTVDRAAFVWYKDIRGRVQGYHMVDGTTILPRMVALFPWWRENTKNLHDTDVSVAKLLEVDWDEVAREATADVKFNPFGYNLEQFAYVQEIDSRITAGWYGDQISIDISQPSIWVNRLPYGQGSLLEQSLELTAAFVNAWSFNQHMFRTNYPDRIVAIRADLDPDALEAAKRRIFSEAGPASWERILMMPLDVDMSVESIPLRDTPRDLMYGDMLNSIVSLKSVALGVPRELLSLNIGEGGKANFTIRGEAQADVHKKIAEEALVTQLQGFADFFTRTVVKTHHPDLLMIFDGLQPEEERERVELTVQKVASYLTIDEARAIENLTPLPNGLGAYPLPVVEQILRNEADLIEAQAEMSVMGADAEGRIKLPESSGETPAKQRERDEISEEFGVSAKDTASSGKKPGARKDSSEPGEARRTRDRAKTQVRSILEQRMADRTKGQKMQPERARADHERRRPH